MKQPPRLAEQFLKWFVAPHRLEPILGDLNETFHHKLKTIGEQRAALLYCWEVIGFFKPRYIKRQPSSYPSNLWLSPGSFSSAEVTPMLF